VNLLLSIDLSSWKNHSKDCWVTYAILFNAFQHLSSRNDLTSALGRWMWKTVC